MTQVSTTEKRRYWRNDEMVGVEITTTFTYDDGNKIVAVSGDVPSDARIIDEADYDAAIAKAGQDEAVRDAVRRAAMVKLAEDKRSAITKLGQLGLTEAQARALTS